MRALDSGNSNIGMEKRTVALESELADVEHEFDDLRKASTMLTEWYRTLPTSITPEQEAEINKLYSRIQKVLRPYYDSIGKLNIEEGPEQQKKIVVAEKKMYGTGTGTYVRWGSKECPNSPMIFKLDTGHMAATSNRGTGGASDYLCLPQNPVYPEEKPAFGNDASTFVTGVKYGLLDDHPFTDHNARYFYGKGVPCATCHLTNRTLVHVFPAEDVCPEDWIYEYSGYLMAGSNLPGAHICVNDAPEAYEENIEEQQAHSLTLVHISEMNEGLPKPPYEKKAAVKCIVCSK
ncbi:uncharacterized protein TNCT_248011 [Trichonephila clavata]|uniref:Uncharacterized protein n=1 Tax=Trichonephila clavata TaxID=2740835 RepID=A0A8X6LAV0_TRICU|nr:uncharacterized protein TNCT_248011 [Trichonephila clavata]